MAEFYKPRRWNQTGVVREWHRIPDAPLYVLSNDARMSALGSEAGKCEKNVCVVPCFSQEEANAVYNYVLTRRDQSYVRINSSPPRTRSGVLYSLMLDWIPRALECLHRGNKRAIAEENARRVRIFTREQGVKAYNLLQQKYQVSVNAHHSCEVCFFCLCGKEERFLADVKVTANLMSHNLLRTQRRQQHESFRGKIF